MASPQPIQTKSITTSSTERRPSTFLELSPIDYSSSPTSKTAILGSPEQKAAADAAAEIKKRRSSSSASDNSAFLGQGRFLKLGGGEGDWSEHVLE